LLEALYFSCNFPVRPQDLGVFQVRAAAMANSFIQYLRGDYSVPGERKLVQKLDFFILTFCCLMYFLNYLDRTNLNNAYVSGMREELNFKGNQLNQINTVFTVGYTVAQVPCNIALYYIKPRYFFPACMVSVTQLQNTQR
jgi:ACS family pantothenate transporter-like MFS transporter